MPNSPCTLVGEVFGDREGTPFVAETANGFRRQYRRTFRVKSPAAEFGPVAVANADGLPLPWAFYESGNGLEYDLLALCVKITAKEENNDDWQYWLVDFEYDTEVPRSGEPDVPGYPNASRSPGTGNSAANNPEMEPPELEFDFEVVNKVRQFDLDGKAFLNSAAMPFDPAPAFELAFPVMTLTRNELGFDLRRAGQFAYTLNGEPFLGYPQGSVLCLPPKGVRKYKGGIAYWRVTYRLKFWADLHDDYRDVALKDKKKDPFEHPFQIARKWSDIMKDYDKEFRGGWQPRILDAGNYQLTKEKGPDGEDKHTWQPCTVNGRPVTSPVCLDGRGGQQYPDKVNRKEPLSDKNPEVIQPVYLPFRVYRLTSFKKLLVRGMQ